VSGDWLTVLEVLTQGMRARVSLNGAPVFDDYTGARKTLQTKANAYVIEGSNELKVQLALAWDPEERPPDAPQPSFRVRLIVGEHGREPGPEAVKLDYTWDPTTAPIQAALLRTVVEHTFTPPETYGRWLWQDADVVALDDTQRRAIGALVLQIHAAFAARDREWIRAALQVKSSEVARALGVPPEEYSAGFAQYLESLFASDRWALEPIDRDALLYRSHANGRLVSVSDTLDGPPIRGTDGERPFVFPMIVSRLQGQWWVVR
jgi:hypothetical protein